MCYCIICSIRVNGYEVVCCSFCCKWYLLVDLIILDSGVIIVLFGCWVIILGLNCIVFGSIFIGLVSRDVVSEVFGK